MSVWEKWFEVFHLHIVKASYPWFYIITKILDSKFRGTIGNMASLQLNLNVGIIADPLTSKMYEETGVWDFIYSLFGPKNILNFSVNSPSELALNNTKISIFSLESISPSDCENVKFWLFCNKLEHLCSSLLNLSLGNVFIELRFFLLFDDKSWLFRIKGTILNLTG